MKKTKQQPLYEPLPYEIEYGGKRYLLSPYFNNILSVFDIQQRSDLTEEDKVNLSLYMLVRRTEKIEDKMGLLNSIIEFLVEPGKGQENKKCIDYIQDAAYIYAAFMQAYHIDLIDQQNKLHWWKFLSLLKSLPDDTKMMQIISIRVKPIPKATKYNRDEIRQLVQLKSEYSLDITQEDREKQYVEGLRKMARALGGIHDEKS